MSAKKKYPDPFKRDKEKKGSPYYFTHTDAAGKRRNVSTGETTKEKARDKIREIIDREASGMTELSFADYAKPYFIEKTCPHFARLRDEGKSIGLEHLARSRDFLESHILRDSLFSGIPISKMKRRDLLDLRQRLKAQGLGLNTVNKVIACAKTILSEATMREDIDANPGAKVGEIKYTRRERGVMVPEEVASLLAYVTERTILLEKAAIGAKPVKKGAGRARAQGIALQAVRDEALLAFLFASGARAGEICALRFRAIDFKTGRIIIDEAKKGKDGIGKPKWGKTREIVLAHLALSRLKKWRDRLASELEAPLSEEAFVFGNLDNKPLGYEGLHNVLETAIGDARTKDILPSDDRWLSPHSARHSLNTNLLAFGVSPLLVQSYLGWTSAEGKILTRVQSAYTHLRLLKVEDVAKAVDNMYKPNNRTATFAKAVR